MQGYCIDCIPSDCRMMMNPICKALIENLRLNLKEFLSSKFPSTGFKPHFGTTCDKSTPGRETNQAILLLVMHKGKRVAIPLGSPKVYEPDENNPGQITGGSAFDLGEQVFNTLLEYALLSPESLSYNMGRLFIYIYITQFK